MPFTFSHPAIVLPATYLHKKYYSLSGLIMGSMVPDFEYFIRMKDYSRYSHRWSGMIWFDLPLGLLLLFLFHNVIRNTLVEHLPFNLNARFSAFEKFNWNSYFKNNVLVVILSLLVGTASHIFWDSFTHDGGYFANKISFLRNGLTVLNFHCTGATIFQYISSILGALVMVIYIFKMPKGNSTRKKKILNFWIIVCLVMVSILNIRLYLDSLFKIHKNGDDLIVTMISGFLTGIILVSVVLKKKKKVQVYRKLEKISNR